MKNKVIQEIKTTSKQAADALKSQQFEEAITLFQKCLKLNQELFPNGKHQDIAKSYHALGCCFRNRAQDNSDHQLAAKNFFAAYDVYNNLGDKYQTQAAKELEQYDESNNQLKLKSPIYNMFDSILQGCGSKLAQESATETFSISMLYQPAILDVSALTPQEEIFLSAITAAKTNNFEQSFAQFRELVMADKQQPHPGAIYNIGLSYLFGLGISKNAGIALVFILNGARMVANSSLTAEEKLLLANKYDVMKEKVLKATTSEGFLGIRQNTDSLDELFPGLFNKADNISDKTKLFADKFTEDLISGLSNMGFNR